MVSYQALLKAPHFQVSLARGLLLLSIVLIRNLVLRNVVKRAGLCGTRHVLLYFHPGSCHARLVGLVRSSLRCPSSQGSSWIQDRTGWFGVCHSSVWQFPLSLLTLLLPQRSWEALRGVTAWKCAVCRIQGTEHCFWSLCDPEGHRDTDTSTAGHGPPPVPTVAAPAQTGS